MVHSRHPHARVLRENPYTAPCPAIGQGPVFSTSKHVSGKKIAQEAAARVKHTYTMPSCAPPMALQTSEPLLAFKDREETAKLG